MNKVFRVIWSEAQGAWVAVSETTKSHSKRSRKSALALALTAGSLMTISGAAVAEGKFVSSGKASIAIDSGSCNLNTAAAGENSVSIGCGAGAGAEGPYPNSKANKDTSIGYQAGIGVKGNENTAIGSNAGENVTGNDNTAFGVSAGKLVTGSKNVSLGFNSGFQLKGDGNISAGDASGGSIYGDNNVMLGTAAKVKGSAADNRISDTVLIGTNASASSSDNVAIGKDTQATHANSVALGHASVTSEAKAITEGRIVDSAGTTHTYSGFAGVGSEANGVVSVGSVGAERQIVNVAAGAITSSSTDAVNGSQLYGVAEGLNKRIDESGGGGWVLGSKDTAGNSQDLTVAAGKKVTLDAGANMKVTSEQDGDGNTVTTFTTTPDVEHTSVTTGDKIGDHSVLDSTGLTVGDTTIKKDGLTINGGPSVTTAGVNAGNLIISNVKAGIAATDGVNVSQLGNVADVIGGVTVDVNGNYTGPTFKVNKTENTTIAGAIAELDKGWTFTAGGLSDQVQAGDKVSLVAGKNMLVTSVKDADGNITSTFLTEDIVEFTDATVSNNLTVKGVTKLGDNFVVNNDNSVNYTGPITKGDHITNKTYVDSGRTVVTGGTNVAGIVAATDATTGQTSYTVNADGASVSTAADSGLTITGAKDDTTNITDYTVGLSDKTKTSLKDADSALQTVVTQVDGVDVKSLTKDNNNANFVSGTNIQLSDDGKGGIQVATKDEVTFTQVTTGDSVLNKDGLTFKGSTVAVTGGGINAGGNKITNLAPGTNGTDAVNVDQLTKVETVANAGWNVATSDDGSTTASQVAPGAEVDFVSSDNNIAIKHTRDAKDKTSIDFALSDDLKIGSKDGTGGTIAVNGKDGVPGVTIDGKDGSIGLTGPKGAKGTISVTNDVVGLDGKDGTRLVIEGNQVATMNDGLKFAGNTGVPIAKKLNDTLTISGGLAAAGAGQLENASGANLRVDSEDGKLNLVMAKDLIDINSITINNRGPVISQTGIDMKGKKITNLAPGTEGTDAVNVDQLNKINSTANAGWNVVTSDDSPTTASKVAPGAQVDFVSSDNNVAIKHTSGADGNTSIDFALSNDLTLGVDGKDGTDGKIAVNGKDGVSGVTIDGKDGSIGLTGPAGANGISPTLTMRPDIKPGDVINNTNSITRITYKDADGNDATLATLENDGLRFSGNDNPVAGYVTRNLNQKMQIKGGATIAGSYSSANIKTVATQDGGIEIQIADSPKFGDITINNAGKISGVEAGVDGKDAVNVSQLESVKNVADNANKGWNVSVDGGAKHNVAPGTGVDFKGGKNIELTQNDGEITINTADEVEFNNVKVGDVTINKDTGITVGDTTIDKGGVKVGGVAITTGGIHAGDKKITGVADGTIAANSKDAVNGGQLHDMQVEIDKQAGGWELTDGQGGKQQVKAGDTVAIVGGDNINVEFDADGKMVVETTPDVTHNSVTTGDTLMNGDGVTIKDGPSITKNGVDAGDKKITSVAKGEISETSTDAINGSQLNETNNRVTKNEGDIKNIQNGKDGMFQVSQDYNAHAPKPEGKKSAAGGAGAVASGENSTAIGNDAEATASNSTALGNSALASANNSVALGQGSVANRANSVSVGSAGAERQITNVAAGVAPTDAVNVSQLEALGGTVNQYFNAANKRIDKVDNNARAGIAAAMAAGTLPQSTLPGKSMVTVGASTYRGESAIALGVSRLSDNARTVIKANASADSRGNAGAAVGAGWHW